MNGIPKAMVSVATLSSGLLIPSSSFATDTIDTEKEKRLMLEGKLGEDAFTSLGNTKTCRIING